MFATGRRHVQNVYATESKLTEFKIQLFYVYRCFSVKTYIRNTTTYRIIMKASTTTQWK